MVVIGIQQCTINILSINTNIYSSKNYLINYKFYLNHIHAHKQKLNINFKYNDVIAHHYVVYFHKEFKIIVQVLVYEKYATDLFGHTPVIKSIQNFFIGGTYFLR